MSTLILCDESGIQTGFASWDEAHASPGRLHLAFSTYIFRKDRNEILIQKRSALKPLWGLIWANTCCSHPRKGEEILEIAPRRLSEECGFTCDLEAVGTLVYRAEDPNGKGVEHEHVTLLAGDVDDDIVLAPDPKEVAELKWVKVEELQRTMLVQPASFAPWFHLGLGQLTTDNAQLTVTH